MSGHARSGAHARAVPGGREGGQTYHKSYRAAFRYAMGDAVPKLTQPTLIAFTRSDMVFPLLDRAHALLPGAARAELPGIETP